MWPLQAGVPGPLGVLSVAAPLPLTPLPPGLLRTASSPHCPSLGVFPLESIFGQNPYFLAVQRVRGSHPPSQAEQSEPLLGPGLSLGLLPPISGEESVSMFQSSFQRTQSCGREDGGLGHAAGGQERGGVGAGSSPWPLPYQGLVSSLVWPPSPSLLCLSHI